MIAELIRQNAKVSERMKEVREISKLNSLAFFSLLFSWRLGGSIPRISPHFDHDAWRNDTVGRGYWPVRPVRLVDFGGRRYNPPDSIPPALGEGRGGGPMAPAVDPVKDANRRGAGMRSLQGRLFVAAFALSAGVGLPGCVERRYTIRTDPPGALVIANGEPIGTTPVSKSFTFYGDRTFRIVKEGYETKDIIAKFPAPWYDNIVTEVFTENLVPYTFRDEIEFNYKLDPARAADSIDVQNRGEAVRAIGQAGPAPRSTGIRGFFGF